MLFHLARKRLHVHVAAVILIADYECFTLSDRNGGLELGPCLPPS